MFAFHTMNGKRSRDDDSDSDFDEERFIKKSRPAYIDQGSYCSPPTNLPYRPSLPPSPPRLAGDSGVITPAHCEYERAPSPESIDGGPVLLSSQSYNTDFDMEMEEDADDVRSQPPGSPALSSFGSLFMRPAMLKPSLFGSDSANTGRIPTPIHPTFKRGGRNGLAHPMSGSAGSMHTNSAPSGPPTSSGQPYPVWNPQRQDTGDERSRRMPSPISEDEDIPDTPTALTQSQLSRLSFSHTNNADVMDTDASGISLALPPTPRGRKRSGALTGMGRFSMGYRDDCEKCRQRVPGHYSHFLT
ncbi:hypothetical protein ACN47E_009757 [Coniothyrium glycines]